jgi:hypothetical protein
MISDSWGFQFVWLPFGKFGDVLGEKGIYKIQKEDLIIPKSLETLAGRPVYVDHAQIDLPQLESDIKPAGITTGKIRESADGLGFEVLTRITCPKVLQDIIDKILVEVSPCYRLIGNIRHYNHFGLFKSGGSRGGSKMEIRLEGFGGSNHVSLPYAVDYYTGISVENQNFNLVNTIGFNMEEQIGILVAGMATLSGEIAAIKQLVTMDVTGDAEEDPSIDEIRMEGFKAGEMSGEIIAEAKSFGFMPVEGSTYVDAQRFVVSKAFPDMLETLKVEGSTGDYLIGLYKTSLVNLKKVAETVVTTAKSEKTPAIPTVSTEEKPAKRKTNRYGATVA